MTTLRNFLRKWNFTELKINAGFLQTQITFKDADREAAWEMYVELLTRITTQNLRPEDGDESTALASVYALFGITRDIVKRHGPASINFAKIAIVILNQVIRPFTAKWHVPDMRGELRQPPHREIFRQELAALQDRLRAYTSLLADIAGVEDISALEDSVET